MKRVPLVQYEVPRILAFDMSNTDIEKFRNAGYNVQRGATGILPSDRGEYLMPCAITDVEILIFNIRDKAVSMVSERKVSENTIEELPFFASLVDELWRKGGVTIIFIDDDASPFELECIGIGNSGVLKFGRKYFPASVYEQAKRDLGMEAPEPEYPKYRGAAIQAADTTVANIYQRFAKSAKHIVLSVSKDLAVSDQVIYSHNQKWHISTDSVDAEVLCLEIINKSTDGLILMFPSFDSKNSDVALSVIKEYLLIERPSLFTSSHSWLEQYKPISVQKLERERDEFIDQAIKEVEEYNEKINETHNAISWMDQLLVGKGDEFAEAVGLALTYLGFDVVDVDRLSDTGNRKREDFRIHDADEFFALVEAKSTDRGASQQMITDTQSHQLRYSKEFFSPGVSAILIVNHSCKHPPSNRSDFYPARDIRENLADSSITAIDSVVLHSYCQRVLSGELTVDEARSIIKSGVAVLDIDQ